MCEFNHILDSNTGLMTIYSCVNEANPETKSTDSNMPQHCNGTIVTSLPQVCRCELLQYVLENLNSPSSINLSVCTPGGTLLTYPSLKVFWSPDSRTLISWWGRGETYRKINGSQARGLLRPSSQALRWLIGHARPVAFRGSRRGWVSYGG